MNLTDKVTVFLISIGASSYDRAKAALQRQDCTFSLKEIKHVAPMSAAFQAMIDRCETPYFVQCDEDMVCRPYAVRTMYEAISSDAPDHPFYTEHGWSPSKCAMICFPVWDVHLQRSRLGIKIYRHEAMKQAPYRDTQSCEVDQIERLKEKGYHIRIEWGQEWGKHKGKLDRSESNILALHGTSYTPREAFETYYDMAQKCRDVGGNDWFKDHPRQFLGQLLNVNRIGDSVESTDLWSLLGCAVGFASPKEAREDRGEKNFHSYYTNPKFGELRSMMVSPPKRLDVYTTSKCNLSCNFCGRQQGGVDMEALQLADDSNLPQVVEKALGYYPSITSACVAGFGEPLLCTSLNDTLRLLERQFVGLITNGVALTENSIDWRHVDHLTISLNAANADEHKERTGVDEGWRRIVDGLAMLHRIKVSYALSFVVGKQEWDRVPEYLQTAKALHARNVYFVNILPHHDGKDSIWFDANVIRNVDQQLYKQLDLYQQIADTLGVDVEVWPQPISTSIQPRNCTGPWTALGVDSRGYYGACPRVVGPGPQWGHIDEGPDLWTKSGTINKLRRELSGADEQLRSPCQSCFGCWKHH